MDKGMLKLAVQLGVVALVAYLVASAVSRKDVAAVTTAQQARQRGRGGKWAVPVAMAPNDDSMLDTRMG